MARDDLKNIVVDSLINKDPNGPYFYKKMYNHLVHQDPSVIYGAPVNPNYLQPLDVQHSIILEDNVFDALETIDQYNIDHKKEVPFILYGYETKGGAIVFDDIYCDFHKLKEASATFQNLDEFLHLRLQVFLTDGMKNKVICLGHTHPFTGRISFNYSIADLVCHLFYNNYNVFTDENYNNKVFSLMKSVSTDYNFIYYDRKQNLFKKVQKVYLRQKKKDFVLLDSFKNCDD